MTIGEVVIMHFDTCCFFSSKIKGFLATSTITLSKNCQGEGSIGLREGDRSAAPGEPSTGGLPTVWRHRLVCWPTGSPFGNCLASLCSKNDYILDDFKLIFQYLLTFFRLVGCSKLASTSFDFKLLFGHIFPFILFCTWQPCRPKNNSSDPLHPLSY